MKSSKTTLASGHWPDTPDTWPKPVNNAVTPSDLERRLNPPDIGRPTAEMLLTLPKFITGEILFGEPIPFSIPSTKQAAK